MSSTEAPRLSTRRAGGRPRPTPAPAGAALRPATAWGRLSGTLALLLLLLLTGLALVPLAPGQPVIWQDSAWVTALNQAVADRLAFGRQVIFNLGPWGCVYAWQYQPATDGMMLGGATLIAAGFAAGLAAIAPGWRRWLALLAPLAAAMVLLHDPLFVATPPLLLALGVGLAQPPDRAAHVRAAPLSVASLLLLTTGCALLTLVKGTFGTQAIVVAGLAGLALLAGRRWRLAAAMALAYPAALLGAWLLAGQRAADLPLFLGAMPLVISGYTEGGAVSGPLFDIAIFAAGAALLLWLLWRDRGRWTAPGAALLGIGVAFSLFVAFKAGFVRHDEHALIALGALALLPLTVMNGLRTRRLLLLLLAEGGALATVSHRYWSYEWPSAAKAEARLLGAAYGGLARLHDPATLRRDWNADLAAIRAQYPLPAVQGPVDIYSSGQVIVLANRLDWSPRPTLQTVTVFTQATEQANLDHLQGVGGPPVRHVFYRVEDEDNRLRATEDGLSWPALLTAFMPRAFDRALDTAWLERREGVTPPTPGDTPLLRTVLDLGLPTALPPLPDGVAWATIDLQPTLLGRVAALLFRPPVLTVTLRYADGRQHAFRLVSGLARGGFVLSPLVLDTEDFLSLLLAERRAATYRPLSVTVSGESGTRWVWRPTAALTLRPIAIPPQPAVRKLLLATPVEEPAARAAPDAGAAQACSLDVMDGRLHQPGPIALRGSLRVGGWAFVSSATGTIGDRVLLRLTDGDGHAWVAAAQKREPRPDVAEVYHNGALKDAGFDAFIDIGALSGRYVLSLELEHAGRRWPCRATQLLDIGGG